jgi:Zn finger protein HypA/HybF involved in hydrogenase expression
MRQARIEGGASAYNVADRRQGPSIEDSRFGRMAYFAGWLTFEQIAECLRVQRDSAKAGRAAPRFGEVAVARGFLSEDQVRALLRIQVVHQGPAPGDVAFGALAVRRGYLTQEHLDEALQAQKGLLERFREAPLLGILLIEKRFLNSEQVREILGLQAEHGHGPLAELKRLAAAAEAAPVPAEDLTRQKVLCRCGACGKSEVRAEWNAETKCPACGSSQFVPAPVVGEEAEAAPGPGPGIEDGRLGFMAYFAGWMTREQVQRCLAGQRETARVGGRPQRFGEVAVALSFLTEAKVNALLRIQSIHRPVHHDRTFGAIAVRSGFVTQEQLDDVLAEQQRLLRENDAAPNLGLMLAEKKLLTSQQVKAIMALQAKHGQGLLTELDLRKGVAALPGRLGTWAAWIEANRVVAVAASAALILLSAAALATGWFGATGWKSPNVVTGCRACGAVVEAPAEASKDCFKCGKHNGLCPIARCAKCGNVFLYGTYGAGVRCPKCGGSGLDPIRTVDGARHSWTFAPPPEPKDAPETPEPRTPPPK